MPTNLEDSAVAWDWKMSVFIPIPKKGNAKECSNYQTIALNSHARKECSKCSKPGLICTWTKNLQMFLNQEHGLILTSIHDNIHVLGSRTSGFRQGSRTRDQIANVHWIIEKSREFQKKNSTSVSLTMPKPLTVWIATNCGKFFFFFFKIYLFIYLFF